MMRWAADFGDDEIRRAIAMSLSEPNEKVVNKETTSEDSENVVNIHILI